MFGLVPFAKNIAKSDDDFNKLFDVFNEPFFHEPFFHEPFAKMNSYVKSFKVDVKDTDNAYELTAELPGIAKENISLDYNKGYLTIKTTTTKSTEEKPAENADDKNEKPQEKYIRRERYVGKMQRSFYIDDIDEKNIKASYQDGILTVVLPKATKEETTTQINID